MKLLISAQYMENYGAHDWDGQGQCPQYWKFKGGEDYAFPLGTYDRDEANLARLVDELRGQIEWDNEGSRQYIVGYSVEEDDYLTEYERSQLEYDGRIIYPTKVLEIKEIA